MLKDTEAYGLLTTVGSQHALSCRPRGSAVIHYTASIWSHGWPNASMNGYATRTQAQWALMAFYIENAGLHRHVLEEMCVRGLKLNVLTVGQVSRCLYGPLSRLPERTYYRVSTHSCYQKYQKIEKLTAEVWCTVVGLPLAPQLFIADGQSHGSTLVSVINQKVREVILPNLLIGRLRLPVNG
jgi:hypothetical protein